MKALVIKKYFAIALAILVIAITLLSILAIWEFISIEHITRKTLVSLIVIFSSSAIILFIFSVFYPINLHNNEQQKL